MQDAGCMGDTHELGTDFQEREKCYEFLWLILWYSELLENVGGDTGSRQRLAVGLISRIVNPFPGLLRPVSLPKRGRSQCCDEKG